MEGLYLPASAGILLCLASVCVKRIAQRQGFAMRVSLPMPAAAPTAAHSNPNVDRRGCVVSVCRCVSVAVPVRRRCDNATTQAGRKCN